MYAEHSFVTWRLLVRAEGGDPGSTPALTVTVRARKPASSMNASVKPVLIALDFIVVSFSALWSRDHVAAKFSRVNRLSGRSRTGRPDRVNRPNCPVIQPPGAILRPPRQLDDEGSNGLARRRHGAARRLESWQPDCAQPAAATRLRGASARCGPPAPERAGLTTPCSRPPWFTRCTSGSSTNARSIGRIGRISLVSRRRSCAASWSTTPVVTARANGARVCAVCPSMKPRTSPRPNEIPSSRLDHALDRLDKVDAQLAKIVELRAFGGLTIEEAAHVLERVAVDRQARLAHRESVAQS